MAGSRNWNAFKEGDRVVWKTGFETKGMIACVAPPCDSSPGTIVSISSEKCGPGSRQFATVQHDSRDTLEWDVDQLIYADGTAPTPVVPYTPPSAAAVAGERARYEREVDATLTAAGFAPPRDDAGIVKFRYEPGDEVGIGGGTRTVHAVVVQDNGATVTVDNSIDDLAPSGGEVRVHPSAENATPYRGKRAAGPAASPSLDGSGGSDEPTNVDGWLALGCGTAVAMMLGVWLVARLHQADDEDAQAPHSTIFRPRFEPYEPTRTSRTYPPVSSRRGWDESPSERLYRP